MHRIRRSPEAQATLFALALLLAGALAGDRPDADAPAPVSAAVRDALAANGDAPVKVWVHFAPRPMAGADRDAALAQAAAALTPAARARRLSRGALGPALVDNRDLPLDAARLAACRATGAEPVHRSRWLNAASFRADAAQVAALARVPGVRAVTRVGGLRPAAVPRPPVPPRPVARLAPSAATPAGKTIPLDYGLNLTAMEQANVPAAHALGLTGAGVVVGVLDTGFRTTHIALSGVPVLGAWDFVNGDGNVDTEGMDPLSSHNHGTMVLSTLAGKEQGQLVAPGFGVSVLLAKTEDIAVEVPLEEDNWVAGLEWAEGLGADLISSSLGYVDWYDYADLDGNTAVTTIAADLAAARGLLVVTAAGNDRTSTGYLIAPGDADSALTVGAVYAEGDVAYFSSPGPTADGRIKPDVAARGVNNTVADPVTPTGYVVASGTSFATPLTSGVVALVLERVPTLTPLQLIEALRSTASLAATPNNDVGWGIIDAYGAATWFGPVIAHDAYSGTTMSHDARPILALVTARAGLDAASVMVRYRVNAGPWLDLPLAPTGNPDEFGGEFPGQPYQTQIDYYLTATGADGVATTLPFAGAAAPFTYFVNNSSDVAAVVPTASRLAPAAPNPFNPRTTIRFEVAVAGHVRLRIFDLQGRLVRTLLDGRRDVGPDRVVWDGRDDAGRGVAAGAYLVRFEAPDAVRRTKVQLVR